MSLVVVRAGVATTVQDRGRFGFRGWGVPVGGAFDATSAALANALVGNSRDQAVLEMTLVGGTFRADCPLALALAGAPMAASLLTPSGSVQPLAIPGSFKIQAGDRLDLGGTPDGARTYLAVRGGWQTEILLGSRSSEDRLAAGAVLPAEPGSTPGRRPKGWPWPVMDVCKKPIRVVDGPDIGRVENDVGWPDLGSFLVTPRSDRMGLRLDGPALNVSPDPNRASMPVAPGAIQVAGGQLLVLGVAGGTMGGYPHVAHVITPDLDRLAQLRPGDEVRFQRITITEARHLDRTHADALRCSLDRIRVLCALDTAD